MPESPMVHQYALKAAGLLTLFHSDNQGCYFDLMQRSKVPATISDTILLGCLICRGENDLR